MVDQCFLHEGKLCREIVRGPFVVLKEVEVRKASIPVLWTGALIPYLMWEEICAFFRQSFAKVNSESLCWLYYSAERKQWAWLVPWQSTLGMTVSVSKDDTRNKTLRDHLDPSFVQIGSIHDHCNGSAFQSGTDRDDETNFNGVHITLGKLKDKELDTDTRVCIDGVQFKSALPFWVEYPPELNIVPPDLRRKVFAKMLQRCGKIAKTPDEILKRVQKRKFEQNFDSLCNNYGITATKYVPAHDSPWRMNDIHPKVSITDAHVSAFIDQNDNVWVSCSTGFRDSRYITAKEGWYARVQDSNKNDFNILQVELIQCLMEMDHDQLVAEGAVFHSDPTNESSEGSVV